MSDPLIDPSLLATLTEEERQEALRAAEIAKRAEERAEQRAIERELQKKQQQRLLEKQREEELKKKAQHGSGLSSAAATTDTNGGIKFVPKRKRVAVEQQKETNGDDERDPNDQNNNKSSVSTTTTTTKDAPASAPTESRSNTWTEQERQVIRKTYLGTSSIGLAGDTRVEEQPKKKKPKTKSGKKANFRFEWDDTDDTLQADDLLYSSAVPVVVQKTKHGVDEFDVPAAMGTGRDRRNNGRGHQNNSNKKKHQSQHHQYDIDAKPLGQMTARDWRIFRENYEIVCKGGRAPPPMRSFQDGNLLHPNLLRALTQVMKYKDPTPIQRQAIPIGMQRRDMIGIAETGSGKTCAFGCPLVQYILQLPQSVQRSVAEQGPLALVLAPTRELALQIHGEMEKLLTFCPDITCCPIVGGQNLQKQAQRLRKGVHFVVGTPGRINECLEMAYMVLNQCLYIVMDEGDRMIDMGFAPQLESILDAMGGTLKSDNEQEAYEQEAADLTNLERGLPKHRLTAMFSATMPMEVEQMAKRYLRHPAVVSVGDQDSGKNTRIVQRVIYLGSPAKKEAALRDLVLDRRFMREKVIVFVNEKRHADGIGRMVERFGRRCVVLHGGKSQEEREKNLAAFRQGGVVLVATDVAGRGLDIPNVAHVINYDLPTRSIDSYSHRIGRTGRAGKQGLATSLMTDEDEGIMAPLKAYLESTGNPVPDRLARHPAAGAKVERNLIY
jgi:ATP-dependent RNA helicase DDX23/PRP28